MSQDSDITKLNALREIREIPVYVRKAITVAALIMLESSFDTDEFDLTSIAPTRVGMVTPPQVGHGRRECEVRLHYDEHGQWISISMLLAQGDFDGSQGVHWVVTKITTRHVELEQSSDGAGEVTYTGEELCQLLNDLKLSLPFVPNSAIDAI